MAGIINIDFYQYIDRLSVTFLGLVIEKAVQTALNPQNDSFYKLIYNDSNSNHDLGKPSLSLLSGLITCPLWALQNPERTRLL